MEVLDDWDEAWQRADVYLRAAKKRDLFVRVAVRPVTVSTGYRRARRCWGVYVIVPAQKSGQPDAGHGDNLPAPG